jgi:hypothetical protein
VNIEYLYIINKEFRNFKLTLEIFEMQLTLLRAFLSEFKNVYGDGNDINIYSTYPYNSDVMMFFFIACLYPRVVRMKENFSYVK